MPVWPEIALEELEDLINQFPSRAMPESAQARAITQVTQQFGAGPSDDELFAMREGLENLAIARRGVGAYRRYIRRRTIAVAFGMLMFGMLLQLFGSWPLSWHFQ